MTRFARAKGSKSSNKKEPEEATPWKELKKGLLDQESTTDKTIEKAEELQKHKNTLKNIQEESAVVWSSFDGDNNNQVVTKTKKKKSNEENIKDISKKQMKKILNEDSKESISEKQKGKKTKLSEDNEESVSEEPKRKKKKKNKANKEMSSDKEAPTYKNIEKNEPQNGEVNQHENTLNKKNKLKFKISNDEISTKNNGNNIKTQQPSSSASKRQNGQDCNDLTQNNFPLHKETKKGKKEFKERRKPLPKPFSMNINGTEVDIVRYDGFPIKKEDAVRLDELKKNLFAKGIPRDEIKKIMKLQRRNAEKALSRAKKHVCFNCRKSGHNLSECPKLNQGEGTGICFKCGSTEHTHFECRVTKKQDFKFAHCFICKEQGHISNQCPDNPRGLYPKGGACKLCGDVTHLKRFCPTLPKQSEVTIDSFLENEGSSSFSVKNKNTPAGSFGNKKHIRY